MTLSGVIDGCSAARMDMEMQVNQRFLSLVGGRV